MLEKGSFFKSVESANVNFSEKMGSFCHSWLKSLSPNLFRGEIWYKKHPHLQVWCFSFFIFCFVLFFCMKRQNVFSDQFYK